MTPKNQNLQNCQTFHLRIRAWEGAVCDVQTSYRSHSARMSVDPTFNTRLWVKLSAFGNILLPNNRFPPIARNEFPLSDARKCAIWKKFPRPEEGSPTSLNPVLSRLPCKSIPSLPVATLVLSYFNEPFVARSFILHAENCILCFGFSVLFCAGWGSPFLFFHYF